MTDIIDRLKRGHQGSGVGPLDCHDALQEIERLHEALKFARKRIEYYGTICERRHFDHDLAEVYPRIDAALTQQLGESK